MPPIEPFYVELGRRIAAIRSSRRISQAELARRLRLTRSSVANVESGKQRVLAHSVIDFALALRVQVSELMQAPPDGRAAVKAELTAKLPPGVAESVISKILSPEVVTNGSERRQKEGG